MPNNPPGLFPLTDWQRLEVLRGGSEEEKRAALGQLFLSYREPILGFLARQGRTADRAEDLVQDFFLSAIKDQLFEKADANKGRFRNLLLTALQHYAAKAHRAGQAQRRHPTEGFAGADISDLAEGTVPSSGLTPEEEFNLKWAQALVRRVLAAFQAEYAGPERQAHAVIFDRLLIGPSLRGSEPPTQRELAAELGLSEKEVANRLVTARRAYLRLLRAEIKSYVSTDDQIDEEIRAVARALGGD